MRLPKLFTYLNTLVKDNKRLDFILVIFLITLGIVSHQEWFNPNANITATDWWFWPDDTIKNLNSTWNSWHQFQSLGQHNIQLYFYFFKFLWSFFANLGASYTQAVQYTFLWPIALLGFIAPYWLLRRWSNPLAAFVGAIFYGSTTYFLIKQTSHLPIAFLYASTPYYLRLFINILERHKWYQYIWFSLVTTILMVYELRIFIILMGVLFLYIIIEWKKINFLVNWKKILACTFLIILQNLYWILDFFWYGRETVGEVANRGIFGDDLFSLRNSIAMYDWSWTGSIPNLNFAPQDIPWFFYILPFLIFFGIYFVQKKDKLFLYGLLLFLIGIALSKQSGEPFTGLYSFLYYHVPPFNLFREASKFYQVTALGILLLISSLYNLTNFQKQWQSLAYKFILSITIIGVSFNNLIPAITEDLGTTFVNKEIPQDFSLPNRIIESDSDNFFRTLSVPTSSRFTFFSDTRPSLNLADLVNKNWHINDLDPSEKNWSLRMLSVINSDMFPWLLKNSQIKYIIVPDDLQTPDEIIFDNYGAKVFPDLRALYLESLSGKNFLEAINLPGKVKIFKFKDFNLQFVKKTTQIDQVMVDSLASLNGYKPDNDIALINFNKDLFNITQRFYYNVASLVNNTHSFYFKDSFHTDKEIKSLLSMDLAPSVKEVNLLNEIKNCSVYSETDRFLYNNNNLSLYSPTKSACVEIRLKKDQDYVLQLANAEIYKDVDIFLQNSEGNKPPYHYDLKSVYSLSDNMAISINRALIGESTVLKITQKSNVKYNYIDILRFYLLEVQKLYVVDLYQNIPKYEGNNESCQWEKKSKTKYQISCLGDISVSAAYNKNWKTMNGTVAKSIDGTIVIINSEKNNVLYYEPQNLLEITLPLSATFSIVTLLGLGVYHYTRRAKGGHF